MNIKTEDNINLKNVFKNDKNKIIEQYGLMEEDY